MKPQNTIFHFLFFLCDGDNRVRPHAHAAEFGVPHYYFRGVGLGDIKFSAAAGLWLGPFGVSIMVLFSAIALLMVGVGIILIKKKDFRSFYLLFGAMACPVTLLLIAVDIFVIRLSIVF